MKAYSKYHSLLQALVIALSDKQPHGGIASSKLLTIADLLISYIFVILGVLTGAIVLDKITDGNYFVAAILTFTTIYIFGMACMGLKRIIAFPGIRHGKRH